MASQRVSVPAGSFQFGDLANVRGGVGFAPHSFERHVAVLAEDRPLAPWAITQTEAPEDIRTGVGIATIERVDIAQGESSRRRLGAGIAAACFQ
jgi:hypothetical protein